MSRRWLAAAGAAVIALTTAACGPGGPEPGNTVIEIEPEGLSGGAVALPSRAGSVKLAVIGDSGRGWAPQHDVGRQMAAARAHFPFDVVLMAGDNIYEGPASPEDYRAKFEEPYAALLADGVRFQAVLGNHDDPDQRHYAPFNMGGERYYTFALGGAPRLRPEAQVFALDSTNLDAAQVDWLAGQLSASRARWKIVLLHHPLYSTGRYGLESRWTRWTLESTLVAHGVDVVFSGHEHIYQRSRLQRGVQYFITGGAGSLRRGDGRPSRAVARSFDRDFHFMLVEIDGSALYFQVMTRKGATADLGVVKKP